jgi:hypothetical protein
MFLVIYRWHVRLGKEDQFQSAWHRGTIAITRKFGSFGSRLGRTEDGAFVGVAEWPSEESWRSAMAQGMRHDDAEAHQLFVDAMDGGESVMTLTLLDDLTARP